MVYGNTATIVLLLSFLTMTTKSSSQIFLSPREKLAIKGSFVIAAICRDGIIIASDSRGNIFDKTDKQQKPVAYFDAIQKIFPIGPNAIAETGQGLILNVFFSEVIKKFTEVSVSERVDRLLPTFIDYCERELPSEAVKEIRKQKLFAAGYINDHPTICYFDVEQPGSSFGCIQDSGHIESAPTVLTEDGERLLSLSSEEAAALTRKAIQSFAKQGNGWKTIGGPISVLLITKAGSRWIENEPQLRRWRYIQDLLEDYREGKISFHLIAPATRQQLDSLLATVPEIK